MNVKKQLISMNYSKGTIIVPEYIVIHETANTRAGADAQAHWRYWNTNDNAQSSVHFVVDDHEVVQLAEFLPGKCWRCWHVGDNKGHSNITNSNSIGIEICVNSDGNFEKARQNCIELVKWLMPQVKLGPEKVVRHYDASGKHCPANMLNRPELWKDFKKQISAEASEKATKEKEVLYRVRTSWSDAGSQIGAYSILDNAKKAADDNKSKGYKVYDASGKLAYDPNVSTSKTVGTPIIGPATGTAAQGRTWAKSKGASDTFIRLADIFWNVATAVGVNPVVAYCQSAKETGFGNFTGVLDDSFMNPCGMKTSGGGDNYDPNAHQRFASWEQGIAAQIDHLALYAGAAGYPKANTPDPRHFPFIKGKAKTVEDLGGNWAPSATYGNDIVKMMAQLEATQAAKEKTPAEISVENGVADGVITSPSYWIEVLNGTTTASAENVKHLIDKYHNVLEKLKAQKGE